MVPRTNSQHHLRDVRLTNEDVRDTVARAEALDMEVLQFDAGAAEALANNLSTCLTLRRRVRAANDQRAARNEAVAISDGDLVRVSRRLAAGAGHLYNLGSGLRQRHAGEVGDHVGGKIRRRITDFV